MFNKYIKYKLKYINLIDGGGELESEIIEKLNHTGKFFNYSTISLEHISDGMLLFNNNGENIGCVGNYINEGAEGNIYDYNSNVPRIDDVIIKIISYPNNITKKGLLKRILKNIDFLNRLTDEKIIVQFQFYILYENFRCLIFKKMSMDLEIFYKTKTKTQTLLSNIEEKINNLLNKMISLKIKCYDIKLSNIMIKLNENDEIIELLFNDMETSCYDFHSVHDDDDGKNFLYVYKLILFIETRLLLLAQGYQEYNGLFKDELIAMFFSNNTTELYLGDNIIEKFKSFSHILNYIDFKKNFELDEILSITFISYLSSFMDNILFFQNIFNIIKCMMKYIIEDDKLDINTVNTNLPYVILYIFYLINQI